MLVAPSPRPPRLRVPFLTDWDLPPRRVALALAGLLVLLTWLAVCVLTTPGGPGGTESHSLAAAPPGPTSFDLPAPETPLTLNTDRAEARTDGAVVPASLPPEPAAEDPARVVAFKQPPPPSPEPPAPVLTPPPPPAVVENPPAERGPTLPPAPMMPQQGDAPVVTNTKVVTIPIVLLSWSLSLPAPSAEAQETAGQVADRLQKIEKDLGSLAAELKGLKDALNALKPAEPDKTLTLQVQKNKQDLDELKTDVKGIRDAIAAMRADLAKAPERVATHKAFSPAEPGTPGTTPAATQIQLINAWMADVTVVVDGASYRLRPGEARMVPHAAGPFTYEVLGIRPIQSRTVASGETFTIRVGPQP
jgi:hypothetical protein